LFKTHLDKLWKFQDVVVDWKADFFGVGDRFYLSISVCILIGETRCVCIHCNIAYYYYYCLSAAFLITNLLCWLVSSS